MSTQLRFREEVSAGQSVSEPLGGLARALSALSDEGVAFVDLEDELILGRITENGASVSAIHSEASELDLLTSIPGFDYARLSEDAATFEVSGARVRVSRLEELLKSKEVSGRPKDVEFLRAFQAQTGDDE